MKKNLTRILSLLLVLVLMVGVLPVSALADGWDLTGELDTEQLLERAEPVEMQASASDFSKILHLDCGRKYFTKDWIIALLYEMQAAGYNQLQLAFGNDGLRFLLNDMSFTANGKSYSHDTVVSKVEAGNRAQNSSNDSSWLTEAEMDAIIAKATELGIEIVPLLNLPGHANALLDIADDTYNATGSNNTLNVVSADDSARNFGMAIFKKYVDYFHSKGCNYFNFGADEYANDASGLFSFSRLTEQEYARFASFINSLAAYIVSNGMTPRAFNDGLYYNKSNPWDMNTSKNTSIKSIQCCYWSSGWDAYPVATASQIAQKTHSMINTHGDFYYVLGKSDKFDSGYSYASGFYNTTFAGGTTITNPVGSMFCIWCDYPNAETETVVAQKTRLVLRAMAARMDNKSIDTISKAVVANGFNEDGTLNNAGTEFKIVDCEGGSTPTLEVGKALTLCIANGASAKWSASPADIVQIEVSDSANANGSVSGSSVKVTALKAGEVTITATNPENESQTATFALTVSDPDAPRTETVTLTVGSTKKYVVDGNLVDSVTSDGFNTAVAEYSVVHTPVAGTPIETPVTALSENSSYYIKSSSGTYLNASAKWVASIENAVQWTWDGKYLRNGNNYLRYSSDWTTTASRNRATQLYFNDGTFYRSYYSSYYYNSLGSPVTLTESTPADKTTITFTGKSIGETSIKVGNVTYQIEVVDQAPDNALTGDLTLEYWITNRPVYKEKSNISANQKVTLSAADEGVSHPDGIAIDTKTPVGYTYDGNNWSTVYYWMTVRLDSNHKQTSANGVDQTAAGTTLTHVRYHNDAWQYKTLDGTWTYFESGDQLVAYYLQKTTVTKDIETFVKDWGSVPGASEGYVATRVALTIAIVYPDGTIQPAEEKMYSEATTIFNYWNNRDIGIIVPKINKNYNISKMTVTDGTRQINSSDNNRYAWSANDTIKWETVKNEAGVDWYDETLVWDHSMNTEPIINASGLTGELKTKCTWSAANTAKLVLIYLEPIQKDTNLNIVYHNDTDNETILQSQIAMVYNAGDAQPTYDNSLHYNNASLDIPYDRKWSGTAPGEPNYLPDEAYVVNAAGNHQTFNKNVAKIPNVAPKYQSGFYKYNGADVSADGKTLTLHYAIDNTKLTKQYVLDFGLPLHIPLSHLIENEDLSTVEAVYANGHLLTSASDYTTQHGTLRYDAASHEIIYTRTATFSDNTISTANFQIMYSGAAALSKTITIGVIPASNILYEENFLTQAEDTNANRLPWALDTAGSLGSTKQATHKNDVEAIFGYDDAYKNSTGSNGAWKVSNLSKESSVSKPLTAEFYGNALDVIGTCDANTAMLMMIISNVDNPSAAKKPVLVDTRYNGGTLNQVPFAHVELESDAHYSVNIRAYYAPAIAASNTNTATTFGAVSAISDFAASASYADQAVWSQMAHDLAEDGLSLDDVEFVRFDDTASAAQTDSFAVYADLYSVQQPARPEGTNLAIDAFRVYRSSDSNDAIGEKYIASEQNIVYNNILDVVKGQIVAFTEGNSNTTIQITDYEAAGGPQNEIYLAGGQSVAFTVENAGATIQVSLRAVQGDTSWADTTTGGAPKPISTNTEMYYTITKDSSGNFVIANRGDALLAIGNVKLPSGAKTMSASEIDEDALRASLCAALGLSTEQPQDFQPKTFTARATTLPMLRNKRVSVLITISNDVSYVTVNGVKYTPSRYYASWQKTRLIQFGETLGKYESKTYTIIAYDANGVASAPITVNG